jgi:hypothetical protein
MRIAESFGAIVLSSAFALVCVNGSSEAACGLVGCIVGIADPSLGQALDDANRKVKEAVREYKKLDEAISAKAKEQFGKAISGGGRTSNNSSGVAPSNSVSPQSSDNGCPPCRALYMSMSMELVLYAPLILFFITSVRKTYALGCYFFPPKWPHSTQPSIATNCQRIPAIRRKATMEMTIARSALVLAPRI